MQRLRYSRYLKTIVIILDILIIAAVYIFFFLYRNNFEIAKAKTEENILSLLLLSLFWILLSGRTKLYDIPRNLFFGKYLERILTHIFLFLIGIALLAKVSNNDFLNTKNIGLLFFFNYFIFSKNFIFYTLKYIRSFGKNHRNVMF
jgi:putative colanic acid biosynthesis UDP-glucose lipid carrier transferase